MELVSLHLQGFKRFEQKTVIDLAGSPIALIGPNEAGKSSVLEAIALLNDDCALGRHHRTRSSSQICKVSGVYLLDSHDRDVISHLPGGSDVRDLTFARTLDDSGSSSVRVSLSPRPIANLDARKALHQRLVAVTTRDKTASHFNIAQGISVQTVLNAANKALASDRETLCVDEKGAVSSFANVMRLFNDVAAKNFQNLHVTKELINLLEDMSTYEEPSPPAEKAAEILAPRRPQAVVFSAGNRELSSTYNLTEVAANPPAALRHIVDLAGVDLTHLVWLQSQGMKTEREDYVGDTNNRLETYFSEAWDQSEMTVKLSVQDLMLDLMVTTPEGRHSMMSDRSDGLRAFVALRAFLTSQQLDAKPILLADEAETHLHYNAQANIVDLFTEQTEAAKIVYTTHSLGCLPRDLGLGVRVIEPIKDRERSTVKKSFWHDKTPGFRPLMVGLGAAAFGFLPSRNVLFGEGPTDAMLYPTLFREALNAPHLSFQVGAGISSIQPERIGDLLREGGNVAFILDGDPDGDRLRTSLREAGVPGNVTFGLNDFVREGTVLEDLLDSAVYRDAVTSMLKNYGIDEAVIATLPALTAPDRPGVLLDWCKSQGLKVPNKSRLAQMLLNVKAQWRQEGSPRCLLSQDHKPATLELVRAISRVFES